MHIQSNKNTNAEGQNSKEKHYEHYGAKSREV